DLILDLGTVDQSYAALADRVQKETGIPYILIDGAFARTPQMLRELGGVLDREKEAEELARHAETLLSRLAATAAAVPAEERPRVYLARGEDGLETSTTGSINAEILASAGAVNVAEDPAAEAHAKVTIEKVRAWNPDVILALGADALTATKAPGWANIPAVAKGRVYAVPALPFGWMDSPPGVNRIIGAAWLMTVLYPGKAAVDLSRETHDFYKLFYHVELLMQDQVDDLLAGSVPE
ncbi:ABC transporter substrate-binding protein, partial [Rhizobiaceae sp. 2RAB30]